MALPIEQYSPEDAETVGGTVSFSPQAYARLEELAAKHQETPAEFVREAIGMMQWLEEVLADGSTILIRHKHGPWEVLRSARR